MLFLPSVSKAQSAISKDAGMWSTVSVQKKISKKVSLGFDQEFRLRENYQRINLFYSCPSIAYKVNDNLRVEMSYRAIQKRLLDLSFSHRHRFQFDVNYRFKINYFVVSNRVRYQQEYRDVFTSAKGKIPENFVRFKTEWKVDIHRNYTPYLAVETRYQIHAPRGDMPVSDMGFRRVRYIFGTDFKLKNKDSFGLYYVLQNEFGVMNPEYIYITGIQYTINL